MFGLSPAALGLTCTEISSSGGSLWAVGPGTATIISYLEQAQLVNCHNTIGQQPLLAKAACLQDMLVLLHCKLYMSLSFSTQTLHLTVPETDAPAYISI